MENIAGNSAPESSETMLPPGFVNIAAIKSLSQSIRTGTFVNIIGFIEDFQEPIQTKGTDWKCTIRIKDQSIASDNRGMAISIFWPRANMPTVSGAADVILVRNLKVQKWENDVSLIANKMVTQLHILPASDASSASAANAPWKSYYGPQLKDAVSSPNDAERAYIVGANTHKMDIDLPSDTEFKERVSKTTAFRDKYSLLKDVKDGKYYNLIGEVIQIFDRSSGPLTVHLSDYTPNKSFYNHEWKEDSNEEQSWKGPFGKMSIQLTLWDTNAEYVKETVQAGDWVLMKNVRIKFGQTGCLEGILHTDRIKGEGSIQLEVLKQSSNRDQNDPRWKEAVRRKIGHEAKFKSQVEAIKAEAFGSGDKQQRGNENTGKTNSKQRRKQKRAAAEKKAADADASALKKRKLNENIRCSYPDQPTVSLAQILEPLKICIGDGQYRTAPFSVSKYRANVRVMDYFPHKLEDFAVGYRINEYEMLSDYSGNEDTDLEEERRIFKSGKGFAKDTWEWRFALQVEDDSKDRLWLVVDNPDAQQLLGLDDDYNATSLRGHKELLHLIREQLFKLWGDLEEQKSAKLPKDSMDYPPSTFDSEASSQPPIRKAGDQPDVDDSDEENEDGCVKISREMGGLEVKGSQERDDNAAATSNRDVAQKDGEVAPKNVPFTCCIKQYGVKVKEKDPSKANAGNGERWQRVFGLYLTHIT